MSNCNIAKVLILGRTGVGKSSFINYLLNTESARVGVGKPITQDMFTIYEYEDKEGMKLKVIDTKGIETEDAHEYVPNLTKDIMDNCTSSDPTKWYHTIFYCVSMNNKRFEPFEAKLINDLSKYINQNIHIVLTHFKEDEAGKADDMQKYIKEQLDKGIRQNINFYRVCSVNKKTRGGEIKAYGRDKVVDSIFETFLKDVSKKISREYADEAYAIYEKLINGIEKDFIKFIDDNISIFKIKDFDNGKLDKKIDEMCNSLESKYKDDIYILESKFDEAMKPIQDIYNSYKNILKSSNSKYLNLDSVFNDLNPFDDEFFNIDESLKNSELQKLMDKLD